LRSLELVQTVWVLALELLVQVPLALLLAAELGLLARALMVVVSLERL
jgi:hypothetical protein